MQSGQIYYESAAFAGMLLCNQKISLTAECTQPHLTWFSFASFSLFDCHADSYSAPFNTVRVDVFYSINTHSCVAFVVVLLPANKEIKFDAIDSLISCGVAVVNFAHRRRSLHAPCTFFFRFDVFSQSPHSLFLMLSRGFSTHFHKNREVLPYKMDSRGKKSTRNFIYQMLSISI